MSNTTGNLTDTKTESVSGVCILTSSDGNQFEVDRNAATLSVLVKEMIEEEDADEKPEIPLPNVKANVLEKVSFLFFDGIFFTHFIIGH